MFDCPASRNTKVVGGRLGAASQTDTAATNTAAANRHRARPPRMISRRGAARGTAAPATTPWPPEFRPPSLANFYAHEDGADKGRGRSQAAIRHGLGHRDCLTVNVHPAIVSVPVRFFGCSVYTATEYITVPFPLPLAPPVMVSHDALLVAVQPQPAGAVTLTLPMPAARPKSAWVGLIAYVHGTEDTSLCTVPPRPTTYSSPAWSSPKEEMLEAVSSSTLCVLPFHAKI